jgi:hypothetical protein
LVCLAAREQRSKSDRVARVAKGLNGGIRSPDSGRSYDRSAATAGRLVDLGGVPFDVIDAYDGMTEVFGCAKMTLGPPPVLPWPEIFGVTTFELG